METNYQPEREGNNMLKKRILLGMGLWLILSLWLAQPSLARVEYALPGERNLLVEGFLENYTIMRSDDFRFSKQMQFSSIPNTTPFFLSF